MCELIVPIPLNPTLLNLKGISPNQIRQHFDILYRGYVQTANEIRSQLTNVTRENQNPRYTEFRSLKVAETYNVDGAVLHELYFTNLTPCPTAPPPPLLRAIEKDFGSYQAWEQDFRAVAAASRGWGALCYDYRDKCLHNYLFDAHNVGIVASAPILLIIDVYEHAYFIDYDAHRAPYIDAFMQNINWPVVMERYQYSAMA